jgi:hypothetical protein
LNAPQPVIKSFKRDIWIYNQGDFDEYRRLLSLTDWESIFSIDDIDKITTDISNTILSAAEATIPNKLVTIRKQDPVWLTNEIRKLIRKKNIIHNKAKRLNKPADWNTFRKIRNDVTSLVRKAAMRIKIKLYIDCLTIILPLELGGRLVTKFLD